MWNRWVQIFEGELYEQRKRHTAFGCRGRIRICGLEKQRWSMGSPFLKGLLYASHGRCFTSFIKLPNKNLAANAWAYYYAHFIDEEIKNQRGGNLLSILARIPSEVESDKRGEERERSRKKSVYVIVRAGRLLELSERGDWNSRALSCNPQMEFFLQESLSSTLQAFQMIESGPLKLPRILFLS